jgi:hypothetical protein
VRATTDATASIIHSQLSRSRGSTKVRSMLDVVMLVMGMLLL